MAIKPTIAVLLVGLCSAGLAWGLYVSDYRPGCKPGVAAYSFKSQVAPNAIYELLVGLEQYHLLDFDFAFADALPGLAAKQASHIPLGLKQQLAREAPLMSLLIDGLEKFADLSGSTQDELEICDSKCRQSIIKFYVRMRPSSLNQYKLHLVADQLARRIAGLPSAPELTNDLVDEVYDEFANYMVSNRTSGELNVQVFRQLEREAAYRSHHSVVFVGRLAAAYQSVCADLPEDFPAVYEQKWLDQMKDQNKAFSKDGGIVWRDDLPGRDEAKLEKTRVPPTVLRPSITRPSIARPEIEIQADEVPALFSR